MTLLELVVSAALFLVLTGLALQFFGPVLDRSTALDSRQENLQRLVLLREFLDARLKNVSLRAVTSTQFEYYGPDVADTAHGRLHRITPWQVVDYDESRPLTLSCQQGQVAERGGDRVRVLWNLGPTGRWRIASLGRNMLAVTLYGDDLTLHDEKIAWEKSLYLVVPGVNFTP